MTVILPMTTIATRRWASYRDLLYVWTVREISARYKQSLLGASWAIFQPLAMAAIFTTVFSLFISIPTEGLPAPLFYYTALLPWIFFTNAVTTASSSLLNNTGLVRSVSFPKEIIPLGLLLASAADLVFTTPVLVGLLVLYQVNVHPAWISVIPLTASLMLFAAGLSLMAAALMVFIRDIRFVLPLILQMWMYVTPVVYPANAVPEWLRPWYMLSPVAVAVEGYRSALLLGQWPDPGQFIAGFAVAALVFLVGWKFFKSTEILFADVV
ncbi:MAG: ABC transporter permease [Chloroflexi bacterium]|nr:ABC transporter permease [Chloroflexota bacterium]